MGKYTSNRNLLHIGCGTERIEGWVNVDLKPNPQVDVVCDVTKGLHFDAAEAIYAEHFLEHLAIEDAIYFLFGTTPTRSPE